jgi:hypothetical protein
MVTTQINKMPFDGWKKGKVKSRLVICRLPGYALTLQPKVKA